MKKVLLAAAAVGLLTTTADASGYGPKGGNRRQTRRTAVQQAGRSSSGGGSNGGATYWGTPPAGSRSAMEDQVRATMGIGSSSSSGGTRYSGTRSAGYSSRGLTGGGLGSYGRSIGGGSRRLGEGGVPDVIVPGQLIRSAGLGYTMSQPETAPSLFAVNGGRISYDDIPGGYALTNHQQAFHGPKDTPPPPNPGSGTGSASGNTGISENGPSTTNIINQKNKGTVNN